MTIKVDKIVLYNLDRSHEAALHETKKQIVSYIFAEKPN